MLVLRLQRILVWGPLLSRVAQLGLRQRQVECPPHIDVRYERAGPPQKSEELVCLGDDVMDVSLCSAEALMRVPVVPTVDLHALLSFAVRCQSTNFVKKGGVFWIDYLCSIFVEYNFTSTRTWFTMCRVVQTVFREIRCP